MKLEINGKTVKCAEPLEINGPQFSSLMTDGEKVIMNIDTECQRYPVEIEYSDGTKEEKILLNREEVLKAIREVLS